MRTRLFLSGILILVPLFPISPAQSAVNAGSTCAILKQKVVFAGFKYSCNKSAKGFVWSKGTRVATSGSTQMVVSGAKKVSTRSDSPAIALYIPTQPKVSNPITFGNILSRIREIPTFAYNNAQDAVKNNADLPAAKNSVIEVQGSHLSSSIYDGSIDWIKKVIAMYGHFPQPPTTYLFEYPAEDISEIQAKAGDLVPDGNLSSITAQIYGNGAFGAGANCQDRTPMQAHTTDKSSIATLNGGVCAGSDPYDAKTGFAHEYLHQIQVMQFHQRPEGSQWSRADLAMYNSLPCWPIEGQATFTGYAILDSLKEYLKLRLRMHPYLLDSSGGNRGTPDPHWTSQDLLNYYSVSGEPGKCQTLSTYALGYSLGFLTVEALTAIAGPESHMALVQRIAQGESLDRAFKEIYSISWSDAQPILAQVVATGIMEILDPPTAAIYSAGSSTTPSIYKGTEGCGVFNSNSPYGAQARIQVLVNGQWEDVPSIESGWSLDSSCATVPGGRQYLAWVKAAIDRGSTYRWIYVGNVNIAQRDEYMRGISRSLVA
jgi:hypothetical protein